MMPRRNQQVDNIIRTVETSVTLVDTTTSFDLKLKPFYQNSSVRFGNSILSDSLSSWFMQLDRPFKSMFSSVKPHKFSVNSL